MAARLSGFKFKFNRDADRDLRRATVSLSQYRIYPLHAIKIQDNPEMFTVLEFLVTNPFI